MINGTPITIVGNVGQDVTLRYTPGGNAVASLTVAVAQRRYNTETRKSEETGTTWYNVIAWRSLAENIAECIQRGNRVMVFGSLASRDWEDKEGNKRVTWEITADAIGPDLTFATAQVRRTTRDAAPVPDDPWADAQPDTGDSSGPSASDAQASAQTAPAPSRSRGSRTRSGQVAPA